MKKWKLAEIPRGMFTNMLAQLKQLKQEIVAARAGSNSDGTSAAGCPPLVTPTSQIVGAQAVNCVIDEKHGKPFYSNNSIQFVNLVKGSYGKTPIPVDPEFRQQIAGTREEIPFNVSNYRKQPNPSFPAYGENVKLASTEKDELLLELFPTVASKFLKDRIDQVYGTRIKSELAKKKELKPSNLNT